MRSSFFPKIPTSSAVDFVRRRVLIGKVSPIREVPPHIQRPYYVAKKNHTPNAVSKPVIKTEEDIMKMRKSCKLAREILQYAGSLVKPGVSTEEIDSKVHTAIIKADAYPSTLLYRNFPKSICTSVNDVICHGIPDSSLLYEGDIISIDVTVFLDGFHGDTCATFFVGEKDNFPSRLQNLVRVSEESTMAGIAVVKHGDPLSKIGKAISDHAKKNGFSSCFEFLTGHGVGRDFHEPPFVVFTENNVSDVMQEGMVFTIEPIIGESKGDADKVMGYPDLWTLATISGNYSSQFEHTVLVTKDGVEVLT